MDRIQFLLDEHIPRAVAQALRRRGIDVLTAGEAALLGAPDSEYLARSFSDGRVLVTQDGDFLGLHRGGHAHAGIAYCEQGARSIGLLVTSLILIHEVLVPSQMTGRVEYL